MVLQIIVIVLAKEKGRLTFINNSSPKIGTPNIKVKKFQYKKQFAFEDYIIDSFERKKVRLMEIT